MTVRDSLLAAFVATVWGFNFVVIDWGMHGVPPLLFVALRFLAVVLPAVFLVPRPQAPWRTVATVGLFMSLGQFGLLYSSMHAGMPPGLAALVLQAQVLFTVLIAAAWLRERPGAYLWLGQGRADSGPDGERPLHHPCYDFNDEALPLGIRWLCEVAETALAAGPNRSA